MDQRAQLVLRAHLLGNVDAEAQHVAFAVLDLDELVAEGDDAQRAVAVQDVQPALRFAGFGELRQVGVKGVALIGGMKLLSFWPIIADASRPRTSAPCLLTLSRTPSQSCV